jgi:uncharacterized protein YlxW (UPF0749 family)
LPRAAIFADNTDRMNILGKIFVFSLFIMSLVLMTFAGAVFVSHTNWKDEIERTPEQCRPGQRPGYRSLVEDAEKRRQELQQEIATLSERTTASERSLSQELAKLRAALDEKSKGVDELQGKVGALEAKEQELTGRLETSQKELAAAIERVGALRDEVKQQQGRVDDQVKRAAKIAAELEEAKAFLAMATERKEQLEKQVANARILLKQSGLTLDSLPKDRVPTLAGDVLAVTQDTIQVSLGADDGLQVGHDLEIFRGDQYIGRATVRSVTPDRAIAVLKREFSRGIVQRGDKVTTRLKA